MYLVLWEAVENGIIEPTTEFRRRKRVFKSLVYKRPRNGGPSQHARFDGA